MLKTDNEGQSPENIAHIALHPALRGRTDQVLILGTLPATAKLAGAKVFLQFQACNSASHAMLRIRRIRNLDAYIAQNAEGLKRHRSGHVPQFTIHKDNDFELVLHESHPIVMYLRRCFGRPWTKRTEVRSMSYVDAGSVVLYVPLKATVKQYTGSKLEPMDPAPLPLLPEPESVMVKLKIPEMVRAQMTMADADRLLLQAIRTYRELGCSARMIDVRYQELGDK